MSALVFKLLLYLCVWSGIFQAIAVQNHRYPTRLDNSQWRFGKRQDFSTKSRFFVWKPPLNAGQIYSNVKAPAIPFNFNRYGIQSQPMMAPIHQSYKFAIPTKVNYASYQPVKDIEDQRKTGSLHHITIINAVIPKPYLSPTPTHNNNPTTTFQNYRTNNKQLYHHQYFNNFVRQNMDHLNKINSQQLQLLPRQQQPFQMVFPSSLTLQLNKPIIDYINNKNFNNIGNRNSEYERNETITPVSQCGRKAKEDTNNSASDILYYYCNNRITNYKNPSQEQLISIQPTTSSTSTTTTTETTTTAVPIPLITTTKSPRNNPNSFTSERPIFLPTPNVPLEDNFVPITSVSILKSSANDSVSGESFKLQRQKYRQKKYEHQQQTISRYENTKLQPQYTTTSAYDNTKFHSFFTIEDAVTRAPEMQVFNDPYQAYRHARRQQVNHQRQISATTKLPDTTSTTKPRFKSFFDDFEIEDYSEAFEHDKRQQTSYRRQISTTKLPDTITTTSKPKFSSFFDDISDDDYIVRGTQHYDYSLFNKPQKPVHLKSELKREHPVSNPNQIIDHTRKISEENSFTTIGETFVGIPKIKEHNFGLFKSIFPTYNLPAVTTYKPKGNFKGLFLTTHETPSFSVSYNTKPTTYTTTSNTLLGNTESIIEKGYNNDAFFKEVFTTTIIPITTTTEKKSIRLKFKPSLNPKSSAALKYPKQRRLHKSYKNLTSTTTKATATATAIATPTLKKAPKYQRQYKTKKLKQFKHLYTTTSTTTTSTTTTTTTPIPTTVETYTKRISLRMSPATSTTEEPTTKKVVFYRTTSTTDTPKQKNFRQKSTEPTKRKKIKSRTTPVSISVNLPSVKLQSARRGSKRANITRSEKDIVQATIPKVNNKNRRRPTISTSTTARPLITRATTGFTSTSTSASTPTPANLRTSSSTTTMKSIMRIANSKSRTKLYKDEVTSTKTSQEAGSERPVYDGRTSLKSITSTMTSIPPLPIEIYFKKSHSPKM